MRVLDLYSGTGGWSQAFVDRGHEVVRIDNDPQFATVPHTFIGDARKFLWQPGAFDVILASPPCQAFSVASIGRNWAVSWDCECGGTISRIAKSRGGDQKDRCSGCEGPRKVSGSQKLVALTDTALYGLSCASAALRVIQATGPRYWWLENPMGGLRKVLEGHPDLQGAKGPVTVTFCQYGESRMKPTDLWGVWPVTWTPHPRCKNGDPCHEAAPRGAKTGTQGIKGAVARAAIPYALSLQVCEAVETSPS